MRLVFSLPHCCPACGATVESVDVDHKRGQLVIWPCRHVVDISEASRA